MVALGDSIAGLMSNNDEFSQTRGRRRRRGGRATLARCRCPTTTGTRSIQPVADIKNIGSGRYGGALTAGLFLRDFVGDVPWAHLDIAGPAWLDEPYDDSPKGGTGFGVRTLIALIDGWADDSVDPEGSDEAAVGANGA